MPSKKKKKPKWVCSGIISGLGSDTEQFDFLQPLDPINEEPEPSCDGDTCPSVGGDSSSSTSEDGEISELELEIPPSSSPVRLTSGDFAKKASSSHLDASDIGNLGIPPSIEFLDSTTPLDKPEPALTMRSTEGIPDQPSTSLQTSSSISHDMESHQSPHTQEMLESQPDGFQQ
ncbi:hypothetical protein Dimus_010461, partial [Dionaea muscipula]